MTSMGINQFRKEQPGLKILIDGFHLRLLETLYRELPSFEEKFRGNIEWLSQFVFVQF